MTDYISREDAINAIFSNKFTPSVVRRVLRQIPSADVRRVVTCARCRYNNNCLTQEFVEDNSSIPFDKSTFFCSDGEEPPCT